MKKISLIITLLVNFTLHLIVNLIPKNKNIWVFGAWFGKKFSDNPKALFEYINAQNTSVTPIWIAKDKSLVKEIRSQGYQAYYYLSVAALWYQARAYYAVICQSLHDDLYAASVGQKTKVVQLWHGVPLKKIMFDVFGDRPKNKNIIGKIVDGLSFYDDHRNDVLIATSKTTQHLLMNAFRLTPEQTIINGFPRNDVFFKQNNNDNLAERPFRCVYMPTFRGGIGTECDLFLKYGFDFKKIERLLIENNIELVLRMHPVNVPPAELVELISTSKAIVFDKGGDIYESIADYDCLITDYSSIYFDYLLSDKPIIFAPFDLEEYKQKERSLYFEYKDVTLEPYCFNWADLVNQIVLLSTAESLPVYKEKYEQLKAKFHQLPPDGMVGEAPFSRALFEYLKAQK